MEKKNKDKFESNHPESNNPEPGNMEANKPDPRLYHFLPAIAVLCLIVLGPMFR